MEKLRRKYPELREYKLMEAKEFNYKKWRLFVSTIQNQFIRLHGELTQLQLKFLFRK